MDIPIQRSRLARYRGWIVAAALAGGSLALTTVALGSLSVEPPAVAQAGPHVAAVARVLRDRLDSARPEIARTSAVAANHRTRGVA